MNEVDFKEYVKGTFRSKVYDALSNVASEFPEISDELNKEAMEEAIEWFMVHFYNL